MKWKNSRSLLISVILFTIGICSGDEDPEAKRNAWKKKDVRDYSDHDLEKLFEQWEEGDEPIPVDELPEWDPRKPRPGIDLSDMKKYKEPEDFLKASKKGQSVMLFVRVSGNPTRAEAEEISGIWQTGLYNSHISVDRFMIEDDRAIFLLKDGELAWEGKDYLLDQERCLDVQLEQKTYHGYHTEEGKKERAEREAKLKAEKKSKPKKKKEDEKKQKKKKDEETKEKKKEKKQKKKNDEL